MVTEILMLLTGMMNRAMLELGLRIITVAISLQSGFPE